VGGRRLAEGGSHTARSVRRALVLAATPGLLAACAHDGQPPGHPNLIGGPLGNLLAASTDLGPARDDRVELTVALHDSRRPQNLIVWAKSRRLSVHWRSGDDFAYLAGTPRDVADAFGVAVHDYRSRDGQVFYAAGQQPEVPAAVRGDVSQLGRILSYDFAHLIKPPVFPLDVPHNGLAPTELRTTYDATALGKGANQTIVFFELDTFNQKDLNRFTTKFALAPFKPDEHGDNPGSAEGETTMDLQVAHGIAPAARMVVYYLPKGGYREMASQMQQVDQQYPGAIWSLSLGYGCDMFDTAADVKPVRDAISAAEKHGTSVFISSGDTGGYECKGQSQFNPPDMYSPPVGAEIGLSSLASLPEVTGVGGTSLSTDGRGAWATEAGWADYPVTNGTGGGVSSLFPRPDWQRVSVPADSVATNQQIPDPATHRLTPDIAADADPATGAAMFNCGDNDKDCALEPGGGTSQSAPIWAALTALMNEYLISHGGQVVGYLNPLLYAVAATGARPAFHDVTFGGNCVYNSAAGFDLATGLGTPDTDNLVNDILVLQKARR
jgi:kumamolisin